MRKLLFVIAGVLVCTSFWASRAEAGVVDCADFPSLDEAYDFFYENGGPDYDPYELDADGDGRVCEWGVGGGGSSSSSDRYFPEEKEIPSFSEVQECELMGKEYNGGNTCSDGFTGEDLANWAGWAIVLSIGFTILISPYIAYSKFMEWRHPERKKPTVPR